MKIRLKVDRGAALFSVIETALAPPCGKPSLKEHLDEAKIASYVIQSTR